MPTFNPVQFPSANLRNASIEELRAYVMHLQDSLERMQRDMNYYMNRLDSENITEVGGWRIEPDVLKSKDGDVGMSTEDTGADDIRFWAGDAKSGTPKFKVTKSGIATLIEMIIQSGSSGQRVVIDSTGFHAYDTSGVERLTIGTTPAEGAKALIGRDASGTEQSAYTYDTETADGASRTGQFITAHGAFLLLDDGGDVRIMNADAGGLRVVGISRPQMNIAGAGWNNLALQSEVEAAGHHLDYDSGTKDLELWDADFNVIDTVNLT